MLGKTLGSYKVVDKLGEGGMGAVYTATHPLIGRKAAVKVLLPQFSHHKEIVERFFNEARAATLIKHAGIIDIFDFGYSDDGSAFIVMEFLDGESLTARIQRLNQISEADTLRLARQMASALTAAHTAGIIHRDFKPDNIFIVPDPAVSGGERVKILDFGIAKLTGTSSNEAMSKTRTGTVMGSPQYMSPEQCRGSGDADARADVYAFGCVLYHMLTGRPPFDGAGAGEVMAKHIYETAPSPAYYSRDISSECERFVLKCLEKKPQDRFESMEKITLTIDALSRGRFATGPAVPAYRTPPGGIPIQPSPLEETLPPGAEHQHLLEGSGVHEGKYARLGSKSDARSEKPKLTKTTLQSSSGQFAVPPAPTASERLAAERGGGGVSAVTDPGVGGGKKRGKTIAIAALVIGVLAAGGVVALRGQGSGGGGGGEGGGEGAVATATPAPAPAAAATTAAPSKPAATRPSSSTSAPPVTPAKSDPPVEKVTIEIESEPKAAVHSDDGLALGETPYRVELARSSAPRGFVLSKTGFESTRLAITPDKSRVERVQLREKKREHGGKRTRSSGETIPPVELKRPDVDAQPKKEKEKESGSKSDFGQTGNPF